MAPRTVQRLFLLQRSFSKPLHSHALIEVTRRFLKREYRDTYNMYHSGSTSEEFAGSSNGGVTPALTTADTGRAPPKVTHAV